MNLRSSHPNHQHDYARAIERRGPLKPTPDHLALLARSCWDYDAWTEFGATIQDPKRPYGNSSVEDDLAELLPHLPVEEQLKRHLEIPAVLSWITRNLPAVIEQTPPSEPVETSGLSELEEYAATLVLEHACDVEYLSVFEMAEEHFGRELTEDEGKRVHDLVMRAEVVVGFRDQDAAS